MFPPAKNCFFPNVHYFEVNKNESFGDCSCKSGHDVKLVFEPLEPLKPNHTRAPSAHVDATTANISKMRKTRGLEAFDLRLWPPMYFWRYITSLTLACSATEPGTAETFHLWSTFSRPQYQSWWKNTAVVKDTPTFKQPAQLPAFSYLNSLLITVARHISIPWKHFSRWSAVRTLLFQIFWQAMGGKNCQQSLF